MKSDRITNQLISYLSSNYQNYPWIEYIHNTFNNLITRFEPEGNISNVFDYLTKLVQNPREKDILVYIQTDDQYLYFNKLQADPMVNTDEADAIIKIENHTFYILFD